MKIVSSIYSKMRLATYLAKFYREAFKIKDQSNLGLILEKIFPNTTGKLIFFGDYGLMKVSRKKWMDLSIAPLTPASHRQI